MKLMFRRFPRTGRTTMPGSTGNEATSFSTFTYEGLNSGSISYSYAGLKYGVSGDIGYPPQVTSMASAWGHIQGLLEPMMRVWLLVEGVDLHISGRAVQRDRLGERFVRLKPDHSASIAECLRFKLGKDAPPNAETARGRCDPHTLQFGGLVVMELESSAADGLRPKRRCQESLDLAHGRHESVPLPLIEWSEKRQGERVAQLVEDGPLGQTRRSEARRSNSLV